MGAGAQRICVKLSAQASGANGTNRRVISAHCAPGRRGGAGASGTCLGELSLPSSWWPPIVGEGTALGGKALAAGEKKKKASAKQGKVAVSVSYEAYEARGRSCGEEEQKGEEE